MRQPHRLPLILLAAVYGLSGCGGGGGPAAPTDNGASVEPASDPTTDGSNSVDTTGQSATDGDTCAEILNELSLDTPITLRNGASDCDYYAERDVRFTSSVVIEPGTVIVMAENTVFDVRDGSINASGTSAAPIQIRGEQRSQGFWEGVKIDDVRTSSLSYVNISDGGNNSSFDNSDGLEVSGESIIAIDNVNVSNSFNAGLRLTGRAIELSSFTNNSFFGNALEGLITDFVYIQSFDDTSDYVGEQSPNGIAEIRIANIFDVANASIERGDTVVIKNLGVSYTFSTITVSGSLTIEPGIDIFLEENTSITIYGDLTAKGTATQGIRFIAKNPDSPYESFRLSGGSLTVSHAELENGGGSAASGDVNRGFITMSGADSLLSIDSTSFKNSGSWGVFCNGFANIVTPENVILNDLAFENMELGNISPGCGG